MILLNTMFTGLIKALGTVVRVSSKGSGRELAIDIGALGYEPEIGASIAICGACQTVTSISDGIATFDSVTETIKRTRLGGLRSGDIVNLEPSLRIGDPLDGHMVLGHVDGVGRLLRITQLEDSRIYRFEIPDSIRHLVAEKGSIAVDGISLTVVEATTDNFTVSVIPLTYEKTTLHNIKTGDEVNLEADVIARYAARRALAETEGGLSESFLRENGFA